MPSRRTVRFHILRQYCAEQQSASSSKTSGRLFALPLVGRRAAMLYYALIFLVVGLIAGLLGIYGVAAMATQIAWFLFLIGIVLLVIHLVTGNRPRSVV